MMPSWQENFHEDSVRLVLGVGWLECLSVYVVNASLKVASAWQRVFLTDKEKMLFDNFGGTLY